METLSRNSLRIVHVEDDNDFAAISAIFLRQAGFNQAIVRCTDGVDALRYFSTLEPKQAPHVILLDLHMAQISGLEVLHWLRHGHALRDIPIYLVTSSDEPEDRRRAAADGATGYLLKTPVFDEIIRSLDQQIEIINQRRFQKTRAEDNTMVGPFILAGEDLRRGVGDAVSD